MRYAMTHDHTLRYTNTAYTKKRSNAKIIKFLLALSIYSTSFDIFLVIHLGGFNFRFTQFMMIPLILLWFIEGVFLTRKLKLPYACEYLLLWSFFQLIFSFRSPNLKNALGYDAWLLFDICSIFVLTSYVVKAYSITWLLRTYINSFAFMAIIGLVQILLYVLGIEFFIAQHWNSRLARINGFSYEPSYYATYMLMGYIFTSYLLWKKNEDIFPMQKLKSKHFLITIALFLSTSRMGWLMMLVWICYKCMPILRNFLLTYVVKSSIMKMILALLLFLPLLFFIWSKYELSFLLNGLGLFGKAAHSSLARWEGLLRCLDIFLENPVLGYGLGGVDPIMAKHLGIPYSTEINGLATSVGGELLVATGCIATIFIVVYFYKINTPHSVKTTRIDILYALIIALNFELLILMFNQNILRPYLWMHLAVISATYKHKLGG